MMLLLLAFAMTMVPLVMGNRTGLISWLSPLHIVSYFLFLGVFVKTVYRVFFDGVLFLDIFRMQNDDVVFGYVYIFLFVIAICVGYLGMSLRPTKQPEKTEVIEFFNSVNRPVIVAAAGIASSIFVLLFLLSSRDLGGITSVFDAQTLSTLNSEKIARIEGQENFGASDSAVKVLIIFQKFALVFFLVRALLKKGSFWPFFLFLALDALMITAQGSRIALANTLLLTLVAPLAFRRKLKVGNLATFALVGVMIIGIFVAMTNFRSTRGGADTEFSIRPALEQVVGSTYFMDVSAPTLAIALSDKDDRFWGMSYVNWTWGWIPRAFWPEKPALDTGLYLKREVLGMGGTIGGINPTGPGEAFLNFGWLGFLIGLLFGGLFRILEAFTLSRAGAKKYFGLWLYPLTIIPFVIGVLQSSFSGVLVSSAAATAVLVLFLKFISKKPLRKRVPRRASSIRYPQVSGAFKP